MRGGHLPFEGSSPLTRGKRPSCADDRLDLGLIPAHAGKTSSISPTSWPPWAHPRSRGENRRKRFERGNEMGSSPLTRGKPSKAIRARERDGLIPAHAGKTVLSFFEVRGAWAHPRSRGENPATTGLTLGFAGSSPLTRGKLLRPRNSPRNRRLIPAHAGKTYPRAVE